MGRKRNFTASFLALFFASLVLFLLWQWVPVKSISDLLGRIISPIEFSIYRIFIPKSQNNIQSKLEIENKKLTSELADYQLVLNENKALSDQFQTVYPKARDLLPAEIVNNTSFIPGESSPSILVIDKGGKDGVKIGQAVVSENNLVGEIEEANDVFSVVYLVTNSKFSITAKTSRSQALGIVKGDGGNTFTFNNVLSSADIRSGDIVVSDGSLDLRGVGLPPDLIAGKVVSVTKKSSALFQNAELKSLVDFSKLSTVFVVIK